MEKIIQNQGRGDSFNSKLKEKSEFKYDASDNEETEQPISENDALKTSQNGSPDGAQSDKKSRSDEHSSGLGEDPDEAPLQKVFVEELGKELLMDMDGNLFDLEGNFIGKANNDEEDEGEMPDLP
jgi:hypothetical protein